MGNRALILIVDDLEENRLMVKTSLKNENYDFIEASDGQEAVQQTKAHDPDIILIDAIMPNMDGFVATKIIRSIEKYDRTPILMITILSDRQDRVKALEYGVNDFISKPFDKLELIARCRSYVNIANINKKYILGSRHPITKLPNKVSLIEDVEAALNPRLMLFRIENYATLEKFFTKKIVHKIEYKFIHSISEYLPTRWKESSLYHKNDGTFVLLLDDKEDIMTRMFALEDCNDFFQNIKKSVIRLDDDHDYDVQIVISYAFDRKNLFENAKAGLNYAIENKRSVVIADDISRKVHLEAKQNINTIKIIKRALEEENVISHYQPLFNNKTQQIEKYESLVRILHEGELIFPNIFLEISKNGHYYKQITKAVLKNNLKILENSDRHITINLSALDIEDDETSEYLLDYFEKNLEVAKRVTFEVLEDENVNAFSTIIRFIEKVKGYGVSIAIDDFGSGYSNFERVINFQPDIIKIDGSLIKNIHINLVNRNIVETIQEFANKIGVKTVAEYVANEEIYNIVNEIGIDYSQGYFIDKPKPIEL